MNDVEFQESNCNGFGDMWWTDKCTYFSSIDISMILLKPVKCLISSCMQMT